MARIEDIPQPTRDNIFALASPELPGSPWVQPKPLADCRLAVLTSAALHPRSEMPFAAGSAEYRELPATLAPGDMLMSHISINFDRIGFQRDVNVVYPIDRMRDLARAGLVGAVADTHYSVMDSTDPQTMTVTADAVVGPSSRSRSTRFCSALSDPSARAP
jgi:D-proline reductase (dithiol) PrdB